jgi:hypothetical protein
MYFSGEGLSRIGGEALSRQQACLRALDFWKFTSQLSEISHSIPSLFRDDVKAVEVSQNIAPDVLPTSLSAHPTIESNTGKLVTAIS